MFLKRVLNQPNLVGLMLITLMICGGLVYTFASDGFNVQTVTDSEVEAWLAAGGDGSSGGSGGGGSDDMSPESPTPENPEDDEEEDEDEEGEGEEGGTEDTSPEESLPEDDEDEEYDEDEQFWISINFKDTTNWPTPPSGGTYGVSGPFTEGPASRQTYRDDGEKSLYDAQGGEWRPSKVNTAHDVKDGHWDYKPYLWNDNQNRNIGQWTNVDFEGNKIPKPNE